MLITETTVQETVNRIADQTESVRGTYRRTKEAILADSSRSQEWKTAQINEEHASANTKIKALKQELDDFIAQATERIKTRLYGFTSAATPDNIIAYRDALDRVDALRYSDERKAAEMLERAIRTKDTTLQQALLEASVKHGWVEVLNTLGEHRPSDASDLRLLRNVSRLDDRDDLQIRFVEVLR